MWRYTNEQTKIGYKVKEEAQILRVKKTSTQRIPRIFLTNLRVVKGFSMHVTPGQLCWNYGTPSWVRAEHRSLWVWTEIKHHENHHWKPCKEPMTALSKARVSFSTNLRQNTDFQGTMEAAVGQAATAMNAECPSWSDTRLAGGGVGLTMWAKREAASDAPLALS